MGTRLLVSPHANESSCHRNPVKAPPAKGALVKAPAKVLGTPLTETLITFLLLPFLIKVVNYTNIIL